MSELQGFRGASVKLTYGEISMATMIGCARQTGNSIKGFVHRNGTVRPESVWDMHINGCLAEVAVCKYLNLFWSGSLTLGSPDVGGLVEVRSVTERDHRLILHGWDHDLSPFVLVYCKGLPCFDLMGWLMGKDGKSKEFLSDPVGGRPAYFVPQTALLPMADLLERFKARGMA